MVDNSKVVVWDKKTLLGGFLYCVSTDSILHWKFYCILNQQTRDSHDFINPSRGLTDGKTEAGSKIGQFYNKVSAIM